MTFAVINYEIITNLYNLVKGETTLYFLENKIKASSRINNQKKIVGNLFPLWKKKKCSADDCCYFQQ